MQSLLWPEAPYLFTSNFGVAAFGDAVWWSRLAQPALYTWAPDEPAVRLGEKARPHTDPEPQALACDGLVVRHVPTQPEPMLLRCGARCPVSTETTALLAWCSTP